MNIEKIAYKEIIRDYFHEFPNGLRSGRLWFVCLLSMGNLISSFFNSSDETSSPLIICFAIIPMLFTIFSGICHTISLSPMMYLIPYSQKMREEYMQKMLYVRISVPLVFAILWNCVAFLFQATTVYAVIIQLTFILFFTFFHGTLHDGEVLANEKKAAFGGIKDFTAIPLVLLYCLLPACIIICTEEISTMEFIVVCAVMILLFAPMVPMLAKRWPRIRANFANYEMSNKMEVRPCR